MAAPRDPIADLRRIAFLLEAAQEPSYRVRAFWGAAATLAELGAEQVALFLGHVGHVAQRHDLAGNRLRVDLRGL